MALLDGIVGCWSPSLGATGYRLLDRTRNANHGTLTNMDAGTDWVASSAGLCLDYDGTNDYTAIGRSLVTAYPFTVLCWWYPTDMTAYSTLFAISASSGADRRWTMEMRNNTESNVLALTAQASPTYSQTNSTASCVANTWHLCVAVFDSATSRTIYLNGRNSATGTTSVTPTGIDTTAIGRLQVSTIPAGTNYAKGRIGETALWARSVREAEIGALLQYGNGWIGRELTGMNRRRRFGRAATGVRRRRILTGIN